MTIVLSGGTHGGLQVEWPADTADIIVSPEGAILDKDHPGSRYIRSGHQAVYAGEFVPADKTT